MKRPNVITPSILSAAYTRLGDAMRSVPAAGADRVHFDVMGEAGAFAECVAAHPAPPSARPGRAEAGAGAYTFVAGGTIFGRRDYAQVGTALRAGLIGDA